jgi:hypothetical protein
MNERLKELAKQAGAELYGCVGHENICVNGKDADELMKAFAKLVRQDEREACAKLCDIHANNGASFVCAATIRARGNHGQD